MIPYPLVIAQAAVDSPSRYQLEPHRSVKVGVFAPEASKAASLPPVPALYVASRIVQGSIPTWASWAKNPIPS